MTLEFLARREAVAEEEVEWRFADGSALPLRIAYYVSGEPPPDELVTSVRAVVLRNANVLVLRNPDGIHALPGGRRERGETYEETLRREVGEETGYEITRAEPLGVAHLRHLAPKPAGYPYPYPDFLWVVYSAESIGRRRNVVDEYELDARFLPKAEALQVIDLGSRVYVTAALAAT